jgi:DNA-directed RNA polymerase specialized sigma24 family protein
MQTIVSVRYRRTKAGWIATIAREVEVAQHTLCPRESIRRARKHVVEYLSHFYSTRGYKLVEHIALPRKARELKRKRKAAKKAAEAALNREHDYNVALAGELEGLGLTIDEIAEVMGCQRSDVKSHLVWFHIEAKTREGV